MKKYYQLTKYKFFTYLGLWAILANLVALFTSNAFFGFFIVFPFIMLVPGLLLLLSFKIQTKSRTRLLYYSISASLVLLLGMGTVINFALPIFGINQPLRPLPVMLTLNALCLGLGIWTWIHRPLLNKRIRTHKKKNVLRIIFPLIFIVLSAMGATSLNNGGTNIFIIILLFGILFDFIYLFFKKSPTGEGTVAFHIFCWASSLLLMTSLRGWTVTGHDIQKEFYVFQLTMQNFHWSPDLLKSPYNACLSITILPTMLASLTHIADAYVFKFLFQLIFAFCAVGVYLFTKSMTNIRIALLSVMYFIAFPTFFIDMPMLNRQEIAFVLLTGMLLLLRDKLNTYNQKLFLFILFGAGIVLSHYSTTYSMLAIFMAGCIIRICFDRKEIKRYLSKFYKKVHRPLPNFFYERKRAKLITFPVLVSLVVFALIWNAPITKTSKGLTDTLKNAALSSFSNSSVKSGDTSSSLFGGSKLSEEEKVVKYIEVQQSLREKLNDKENYYPSESYASFNLSSAEDKPLQLTFIGRILQNTSLNIYDTNALFRLSFAKILQVFILLGLVVLLFSKRHNFNLGKEVTSITLASMLFLGLLIFIPVLSLDYGLLRAFQQVLTVLALPVVLGSLFVFSVFKERIMVLLAVIVVCLYFATSVGLVSEMTGGYISQLHMHNMGKYYDSYYLHNSEVQAFNWLKTNRNQATNVIQGDQQISRLINNNFERQNSINFDSDIYPGLVQRDAYVFLGKSNTTDGKASAIYQNEGITYNYPTEFLDNNKNLIYNNGNSKIYK